MDQQIVTDAVRTLRTRGERVSVRAVHGLTGGSFRDVSRLLRDAREYLAEDEAAELDADVPAPVLTPSLGRIAEASMAVRAAEAAHAEASAELNRKRDELRALRAAPPVRRTRPEEIAVELDEEDEYADQCQRLARHIARLEAIVAQRQAEALSLRSDHEKLIERLRQLETSAIPAATRDVAKAEDHLAQEVRDAATRVRVATADAEHTRARLRALDAEGRALVGDGVRR